MFDESSRLCHDFEFVYYRTRIFLIKHTCVLLFVCSFRCVALKEYMAIDLDKYHCPRCETMCGPSLSKLFQIFDKYL